MFNPLMIWKVNKQQELKNRTFKNREAILDIMSENVQGARQCENLLGAKCIGVMCEHFRRYKNINDKTGEEFFYYQCVYNKIAELQIETLENLRETNKLLRELINQNKGETK